MSSRESTGPLPRLQCVLALVWFVGGGWLATRLALAGIDRLTYYAPTTARIPVLLGFERILFVYRLDVLLLVLAGLTLALSLRRIGLPLPALRLPPQTLKGALIGLGVAGLGMALWLALLWWASGTPPLRSGGISSPSILLRPLVLVVATTWLEQMVYATGLGELWRRAVGGQGWVALNGLTFALGFAANPHLTAWAFADLALVGVVATLCLEIAGAATAPFAFVCGWRVLSAWVLGLPVNGVLMPGSVMRLQGHSDLLLRPRDFGIENGLLATVVLSGCAALLAGLASRQHRAPG